MSGFDTGWLGLREPADLCARDHGLLGKAASLLNDPDAMALDLGCGTGSMARAFPGQSQPDIRWRLVDQDAALLAEAKARLGLRAETFFLDLMRIEELPLHGISLVTASALFDLCSQSYIEKLAQALATRRLPLYTALNYDGAVAWEPAHPHDGAIIAAFNRHQKSDKGFGPALGPDAARILPAIFRDHGYAVSEASSPWHLAAGAGALQAALITGIAAPVLETGLVDPPHVRDWERWRLDAIAAGATCRVGHHDMLALPR